jgi:TolA-binding protein
MTGAARMSAASWAAARGGFAPRPATALFLVLGLAAAGAFGAAPAAAQNAAERAALERSLVRLDALEAELRRITAQLEESEFRRRRAEADFEARLQDLEFRIIELEGGDPTEALRRGEASAPPPVAAAPAPAAPAAPAPQPGAGQDLGAPPQALGTLRSEGGGTALPTVGPEEQAAFNAAARDLELLGPTAGRESFDRFFQGHPGSALGGEAWRQLGAAYARDGRYQEAARAFLAGVRDHGDSAATPENLLGLGDALTDLGQMSQACGAYADLQRRFPQLPAQMRPRLEQGRSRAGCS